MPNEDAMTIGVLVAGFAWTLWWNLDWRRYLKFYGIKGPAYPAWVQIPFRIFFAACSLGTAAELGRRLLQKSHPIGFYFACLKVAGACFVVIVLMVFIAERATRHAGKKVDPS
jgi:hypothetical protein